MAAKLKKVFSITELTPRAGVLGESGIVIDRLDLNRFEWDSNTQSAPFTSWNFGGTLRTNRNDYAGSDVPVEQVLGWNYDHFTINGKWDDKWAGDKFAFSTWRNFELMVKRGALVKIEFEDIDIVGLIINWNFNYLRSSFIEYEFTVSPHFSPSRDKDTEFLSFRAEDPREKQRLTAEQVELITDIMNLGSSGTRPAGLPSSVANVRLEVNELREASDAVFDLVENRFLGPTEQAVSASKRLAASFAAIKTKSFDIINSVSELRSDADIAFETATSVLDHEAWKRGLSFNSRLLITRTEEARKELETRSEPDAARLYRPREGEHLYNISQHFYGSIANARDLLDINDLDSYVMEGNELLVIPEIGVEGRA